jgi:hypothetical protein
VVHASFSAISNSVYFVTRIVTFRVSQFARRNTRFVVLISATFPVKARLLGEGVL